MIAPDSQMTMPVFGSSIMGMRPLGLSLRSQSSFGPMGLMVVPLYGILRASRTIKILTGLGACAATSLGYGRFQVVWRCH